MEFSGMPTWIHLFIRFYCYGAFFIPTIFYLLEMFNKDQSQFVYCEVEEYLLSSEKIFRSSEGDKIPSGHSLIKHFDLEPSMFEHELFQCRTI